MLLQIGTTLLQIGTAFFYYKSVQALLQIGTDIFTVFFYKLLQIGTALLQIGTDITYWYRRYYKLVQILHIGTIITNWSSTNRERVQKHFVT